MAILGFPTRRRCGCDRSNFFASFLPRNSFHRFLLTTTYPLSRTSCVGGPEVLTMGDSSVIHYLGGWLPDPHWDCGRRVRVMTRPTTTTAKHGVGVCHVAACRKEIHVMRITDGVCSLGWFFLFSHRIGVSLTGIPHGREGHWRTQVSSRQQLV